ncbi:von Willebrand factor type A domain-containing protein [Raineyella antarctica]|uniref:von Willebrand factor type A domain-containing protein n=1 Tax=Raineyella antarctica TaxID=1577474 RepID=A0A1G6GYC6_9ACTN|nr:vWA domain-containing protein [Raineyella antarctica]SDB87047.1 von Willebrand factor type A domain-containing protein [Raineyella antarctica]
MVDSLSPDDRLAIITFDTKPQVRQALTTIGSDRQSALSSLPSTPVGQATDIGTALNAAVDLMEGGDLRQRGAVLLFTDGTIDTASSSPYATVNSAGWTQLHQRAAALQGRHDIAPLAIALTSDTDAAVLKRVFANVTDVPASRLGNYLPQVSTDVMKAAAVKKLQDQLAAPVQVSVEGPLRATSGAAPRRTTLILHNANTAVPVRVDGLAVEADPASGITVGGLPESVDIPAAGTVTVEAQVSTTAPPGTTVPLAVTGTVTSPWQAVITGDLGLSWQSVLTASPMTLTASKSAVAIWSDLVQSRSARIGGLVLLALVVLGGVWGVWLATRPRLAGSLTVTRDGAVLDERLLRGRSMSLGLGKDIVSAQVTPVKDTEGERGVVVQVSAGTERKSGSLFEGDSLTVGDLTIRYTTDRARMLQLIGTD